MNLKKVIIIDPQARLNFTHHLHYVEEFANYFCQIAETKVFISKYSKFKTKNQKYLLKKNVWSFIYGPSFFDSPINFLLVKLCEFFAKFFPKQVSKHLFSFVLYIICFNLLIDLKKDIKNSSGGFFIIFPSLDLTGIYVLNKLRNIKTQNNIHFHCRILGTENRGFTNNAVITQTFKLKYL